ncbi:MAG: cbb3-type cytochrome oxidase assembly protein CcoS [Gammaproteobacteria bacterium]|nr:cbb3-type cytochrome oxidase assembly protein CcoS [Gammaproteobacteria bacterium]
MRILLILIPLSLLVLGVAVWAFFWAVRSGQFEDMDAPAWRVVLDDDEKPPAADEHADHADRRDHSPDHHHEHD